MPTAYPDTFARSCLCMSAPAKRAASARHASNSSRRDNDQHTGVRSASVSMAKPARSHRARSCPVEQPIEFAPALHSVLEQNPMQSDALRSVDIGREIVDENALFRAQRVFLEQVREYLRLRFHHPDLAGYDDTAKSVPEDMTAPNMVVDGCRHVGQTKQMRAALMERSEQLHRVGFLVQRFAHGVDDCADLRGVPPGTHPHALDEHRFGESSAIE